MDPYSGHILPRRPAMMTGSTQRDDVRSPVSSPIQGRPTSSGQAPQKSPLASMSTSPILERAPPAHSPEQDWHQAGPTSARAAVDRPTSTTYPIAETVAGPPRLPKNHIWTVTQPSSTPTPSSSTNSGPSAYSAPYTSHSPTGFSQADSLHTIKGMTAMEMFAEYMRPLPPGGENQERATNLRKPTPEIIDLTSSPAPSQRTSRAPTPTDPPSSAPLPETARPTQTQDSLAPPSRQSIYDPKPQSSLAALSKVWSIGPFPQPPTYIRRAPNAPPPPRRGPTLPPDPKDVIDLSALSDPEDEEMADGPPAATTSIVRMNPRTNARKSRSSSDDSVQKDDAAKTGDDYASSLNSDDEQSEEKGMRLRVLKSPDVFTVGQSHYACTRDTLKKQPKVLSKAEEREVTEWYKGAYARRQAYLEQQSKASKTRGRISVPDPEPHREQRTPAPYKMGPAPEPMNYNPVPPPPPPPAMRYPMPAMPMGPSLGAPYMNPFLNYISNPKLPPLTLKGNGALVPGTCRKLFRRYRLEMCHGCDTKQRCSKKDMWKLPDPKDPSTIPPEPANSVASALHDRGYYHPDMMMHGMHRPMPGMVPPDATMRHDIHPAYYSAASHGPYAPGPYLPHMHRPPPAYPPYPPPPRQTDHHVSSPLDKPPGPPRRPSGKVALASPRRSPTSLPHRSDVPQVIGQKRPASPYMA